MMKGRADPFEEEKRKMIAIIRNAGIHDEKVLDAMDRIPRHLFVDEDKQKFAYENTSLGISCEQTISQPFTVAYMTQELRIKAGDRVLEVGTGSGLTVTGASPLTMLNPSFMVTE